MKHLYAWHLTRLPLFSFLERVDDANAANDELHETFLNEVFLLLTYVTYSPGEQLITFSDAADDIFIFESGKVLVGSICICICICVCICVCICIRLSNCLSVFISV